MKKVGIQEARKFSLSQVQVQPLVEQQDLTCELMCFEAGQGAEGGTHAGSSIYQVLEGEALISSVDARERLGKGRLVTVPGGVEHKVENAGGGLLVVLATRAR